jgi:hypothetical protein
MPLAALVGVVVIMAIAWGIIVAKRHGADRAVAAKVRVTSLTTLRSPDGSGTDAIGSIANENPFPVIVTVLAQGIDIGDNIVTETTLKPYRVLPGRARELQVHLSATPLKSVTFEAVRVDAEAR